MPGKIKYTKAQDALILQTDRGALGELAVKLGSSYSAITARRRKLKRSLYSKENFRKDSFTAERKQTRTTSVFARPSWFDEPDLESLAMSATGGSAGRNFKNVGGKKAYQP